MPNPRHYAPCWTEDLDCYILEAAPLFIHLRMRFAIFPTSWNFWIMLILNLCSIFKDQSPIQLFLTWIHATGCSWWWPALILLNFRPSFWWFLQFFTISFNLYPVLQHFWSLSQLLIFGKLNTTVLCSITQVIYSSIEDFTQHIYTFSLGSNSVLYVGITVSARLHLP